MARHLRVHERSNNAAMAAMGALGEYAGVGRRRWGGNVGVGGGDVRIVGDGRCIVVGEKVIRRHVIGSLEDLNNLKGS